MYPLIQLTKKDTKFQWTDIEEKAFNDIKSAILNEPTVIPPDTSKPFYIVTDASKHAISGILMQKKDENFHPIEFFGRKLKDSESRYPSFKLELLAIHDTIMHFKNLIRGQKIFLETDSKALTYFISIDKQPDIVARWLLNLQDFDINIKYLPGCENPSDFLSRHVLSLDTKHETEFKLFNIDKDITIENITHEQQKDKKFNANYSGLKKQKVL